VDQTPSSPDKSALRRRLRAELAGLAPGAVARRSEAVLAALVPEIARGTVLAYAPLPREVQLDPVLVTLATEGRLVLPRVVGEELSLHRVADIAGLRRGSLGIREPGADCPRVEPGDIEVVLVPGLAFGRDGTRLGRGGGYFDRLLPRLRARRVGACFALQLFDTVPTEPHDARVDAVVTEEGCLRVG